MSIPWIRSRLSGPKLVSIPSINYKFKNECRHYQGEGMSGTFQYTLICSACCCCTLDARGKSSITGTEYPYGLDQHTNEQIRKKTGPGLDAADLAPRVASSATSSSRNEFSVSSARTPKSTQVTRAFSAELLSTEPTRGIRLSKDHTSSKKVSVQFKGTRRW